MTSTKASTSKSKSKAFNPTLKEKKERKTRTQIDQEDDTENGSNVRSSSRNRAQVDYNLNRQYKKKCSAERNIPNQQHNDQEGYISGDSSVATNGMQSDDNNP